jgi:hypothetical protein
MQDLPKFRRNTLGLTIQTLPSAKDEVENSDSFDSFSNSSSVATKELTTTQYILDYMSKSSLFMFHRDSCFRRFFIRLTHKKGELSGSQDTLLSQL